MKTKNKFTPHNPIQPIGVDKQEEQGFYNLPTSPASRVIMDIFQAGENLPDLQERKKQVSHSITYEVGANEQYRFVTYRSDKSEVSVELDNIDKIIGSNKPAKKLFILSLIKMNEQAVHNGQLSQDYISFPVKELTEIGFYKTYQSASKGFKSGAEVLTSIKVKGEERKTKKKKISQYALEVLFTGANIERGGQCYIYLNPRINWGFMLQYFTILPPYYFRLPNRASDLLYYICYLARQKENARKIEERGYFTISFRAIHSCLQLPSELQTKNPQRDIKDAIEEAVEQIENENKAMYPTPKDKLPDFTMELVYGEYNSIEEYLVNGYLKVMFKGAFAQSFIELSKNTAKQIEASRKKSERIQEKAIATNLAKSMEEKPKE